MKGAGGTEGGVAQFFVGLAMAVGGAYLLTQRVSVTSGFWSFFGGHTSASAPAPVVGAGDPLLRREEPARLDPHRRAGP